MVTPENPGPTGYGFLECLDTLYKMDKVELRSYLKNYVAVQYGICSWSALECYAIVQPELDFPMSNEG
jgi:hypothetical protein